MKVHLDTDLGGDIDDLCALAMLLRWSGVEITAVTTAAEEKGRRAGYVRRVLNIERREEIPVAAGADAPRELAYPDEETYWGNRVAPAPNSLAKALLLLKQSIEHDPLACAIAVGWNEGVEISHIPLKMDLRDGLLHEIIDLAAKPLRVITKIDGNRFSEFWIDTVARINLGGDL